MSVSVKMFGLEKIQKLRVQLPGETEEQIEKVEAEFIKFVQKSAKIRAPRFSGQLAESITFKKKNKENWELTVGAPYGWFQEHGFNGEFLSAGMAVAGGYRIGDWMQAKGMSGFGFRPSGKPHPFVTPAIEQGLNQIPHMLQNSINNMDIK
jgi:hypothetical protein